MVFNDQFISLCIAVGQAIGLMALLSIFFGMVERLKLPAVLKSVCHGFIFGAGAVFTMMSPIEFSPGVLVDGRTIIIGLAAAFGGLPAAIISGALTGTFRIHAGGIGVIAGCTGIFLAAVLGYSWSRFIRPESGQSSTKDLMILGAVLCMSMSSLFLLPLDIAFNALQSAVPLFTIAILGSSVVLGSFMERELRLITTESTWRENAVTDELTGVFNRRKFISDLDLVAAEGTPYAMLIIDIDHFKQVNDQYGHAAGDQALVGVAETIQSSLRSGDGIYRIGGEEFAIILPNVAQDVAHTVASRIQEVVNETSVSLGDNEIKLTVSIGAKVAMRPSEEPALIFDQADQAVYAAKQAGRNCVKFADGFLVPAAAA